MSKCEEVPSFYFSFLNNTDDVIGDSIKLGKSAQVNIRTGSFTERFIPSKTADGTHEHDRDHLSKQRDRLTLSDYMCDTEDSRSLKNVTRLEQKSRIRRPHFSPAPQRETTELDPVLDLLKSDIYQLEKFRKSFSVRKPRKDEHSSPTTPRCERLEKNKDDVFRAQKLLNNELNNLIEIEFYTNRKRRVQTCQSLDRRYIPNPVLIKPYGRLLRPCDSLFRSDEGTSDSNLCKLRKGKFRWSAKDRISHQRGKPNPHFLKYKTDLFQASPIPSTLSSSSKNVSPISVPKSTYQIVTLIPSEKHDLRDTCRELESLAIAEKQINIVIRENLGWAPLWIFTSVQLSLLQKVASLQLALIQRDLCRSNRIFRWRFAKNRQTPAIINTEPDGETPPQDSVKSPDKSSTIGSKMTRPPSASCGVSNSAACWPASISSPPISRHEGGEVERLPSRTSWIRTRRNYSNSLFGQSLSSWCRRIGQPLPPCIINMLNYLQENGLATSGLFRRAGGQSRIQLLRECVENDIYFNSFADWQPYDVADVLKQFFRELPECLLTKNISANLVDIFYHSPKGNNLSLLRWSVISLPDENRIALQSLLYFLKGLSKHSLVTKMTATNLAICFSPTLFHLSNLSAKQGPRQIRNLDELVRSETRGKEEQIAAQNCLTVMIVNASSLFDVSDEALKRYHIDLEELEAPDIETLCSGHDLEIWVDTEAAELFNECGFGKNKFGWTNLSKEALKFYTVDSGANENLYGFEIAFKKAAKSSNPLLPGSALRIWRCSLLISKAEAQQIVDKFWCDRITWDENILRADVMETLTDSAQIHRVLFNAMAPQPAREFRMLRAKCTIQNTDVLAIVSQSIRHGLMVPESPQELLPTAHFFKDHVLVEPIASSECCRVTLLSAADLKGFSQTWYSNQWGHFLLRRLLALRHSLSKLSNENRLSARSVNESPIIEKRIHFR